MAAIFFTATILERRMHRINELKYSLPPIALIAGGLAGLILLEPDFGTAVALLVVVGAMVAAAGLRYRYVFCVAGAGVALAIVAIVSAPYRLRRFLAFWNPDADPLGDGYHILQSLIAVGSGGWLGRGLMGGVQKLFYLPEPQTDFIYAVIAEELGLMGATFVLLCFGVIAWRGLKVAMAAPDRFGAFLALGHHDDGRRPGVSQRERRARVDAHQGHSAAARQQRRVVAARESREHRGATQHLATCRPRVGGDGARSRVIRAGPDRGRRHGWTSLPRHRRGRRAHAPRVPSTTVTFVGTARGLESRVVPAAGFTLDLIRSAGLKGKSLGGAGARALAAAPVGPGRVARVVATQARRGGRSGRLQLGSRVAPGGAEGRAHGADGAERRAGLHESHACRWVRAAALSYDDALPFFPARASFGQPGATRVHRPRRRR